MCLFVGALVARADQPFQLEVGKPISLFDGKTLQGWVTADGKPVTKGWKVEEGAIYRDTRGGNIFYEHEVGDFELTFEWKIVKGGNNGLKYRVRKYGNRLLGCEYQLLGETGRSLSKGSCGSLYALYEPNEKKKLNPPGQWNTAKIVAHGPKIEHWMNGEKIVAADLTSDQWRTRLAKSKFAPHKDLARNSIGRIMITEHGSKVWYRNLVLTPLETEEIPPLAPSTTSSLEASKLEGNIQAFLGEPRFEMQQVFKNERFPNVVVTLDGTVLATWGNNGVRVRRSEDGGKTWGKEIVIAEKGFQGGGTTVDEASGDVLVFVEEHHPPAPLTVYRSKDGGKTWNKQQTVIKKDCRGNMPSMHMNEHGITLRHGKHAGRLLRPARYYGTANKRSEWPNHYTTAIYSDDGGMTWKTSDPFPENGTGEAAVAELSDGRIYYNSRVHWQERPENTRRRCAWSYDGGQTWKDWQVVAVLPDGHQHRSYGCMGGLVRLPVKDKDILVFSNLDTPNAKRERITVWASKDGGKTWPVKRLVYDGPSAYSSLNAGRPGTPSEGWIYLHFEGGPGGGSQVARFNLSWILEGEATGQAGKQ